MVIIWMRCIYQYSELQQNAVPTLRPSEKLCLTYIRNERVIVMAVMECRQQNNVGTLIQELQDVASGLLLHTICKFVSASSSTRVPTEVTVKEI